MAYYQFDSDSDEGNKVESLANASIAWLVRFAGLALLAVGLWTAITIISEAWSIYTNPRSPRIDAIARAINDATHMDFVLAPQRPAAANAPGAPSPEATGAAKPQAPARSAESGDTIRLSYFLAWAILLMLLLLVGRLSMAAIKTGGELALYDVQIRRFARELMREAARERSRGG